MEAVESEALLGASASAIREIAIDHRFTAKDICQLHRSWLGEVYAWAGQYRDVNVSRDGFMFAAAAQIPRLMQELEHGPLRAFTPCTFADPMAQVEALAITHAELILIHPFREGNGRCARMLAALMALQAGLPVLNYGGIRGRERKRYIAAVHSAVVKDYEPMREVFRAVIRRSWESAGEQP
jgi:cell filamentation protein